MYATWARAIRSAALRAPKARVATHRGPRHLHVSAALRREAAAAPSAPAPAPGDAPGAGSDATDPSSGAPPPDKDGKGEGASNGGQPPVPDGDENLFGSSLGLSSAGESRNARQKRSLGPTARYRSRTRTQEQLPPVQIPSDFRVRHVYRWDQAAEASGSTPDITLNEKALDHTKHEIEQVLQAVVNGAPSHAQPALIKAHHDIFEAAAWSASEVQEFRENPQALDSVSVSHRGYTLLISAVMKLLEHRKPEDTDGNADTLLALARSITEHSDVTSTLKWKELYDNLDAIYSPGWSHEDRVAELRNRLRSKLRFHSSLGSLHYDSLQEATSSIRAELILKAPAGTKAAELRRPATIINFPYYSGPAWPRAVVQDIAADLQADVLHLTAQDIAQVVGSYIGQDPTRSPGPIAMLGYKAAHLAGRTRPEPAEQSEPASGLTGQFQIVIPTDKGRHGDKKAMSLMDHLLGEPTRRKPDETWEDLKISTALEELVRIANSDASEQRPLIVHINDFQALGLDGGTGAIVLGKLRKVIDTLWCEGREIVLVGTCSSSRAPLSYLSAMKELKEAERVITLHTDKKFMDAMVSAEEGAADSFSLAREIRSLQQSDFRDENAANIRTMLDMLLAPNSHGGTPRIEFNLGAEEASRLDKSLSDSVLPANEVYRIATTMIGLPRRQPDVFDQSILERTLRLLKDIDDARETLAKSQSSIEDDIRRNTVGGSGGAGSSSDHEDRMSSMLVDPKDIRTTFNDIHAPQETIDSIKMLTQLSLLRPEAFTYGVLSTDRIPGCLLYGPPGTGKTLLAKAVAKESGANMVEVSGASINNMYVGESEKNIRALFNLAKKKEPLVIFIDEADALLGARGGRNDAAGRRSVINQFLREWDGMDATKAFIMVATNRPFDLDEAVLRRLPRKLLVDLPLEKDRAAILRIHLRGETLDDTVSIEQMAKQTPLYSGSDLKNVCVAAAMAAVKEELEASEKHEGNTPYRFPERRVLSRRHFDRGLAEIPASVSEDMATLGAIKKFDERYGERKARRKRRGMGFEVVPEATDSHEARVRSPGR